MHSHFSVHSVYFSSFTVLNLEEERAGRVANVSGDFRIYIYMYVLVYMYVSLRAYIHILSHAPLLIPALNMHVFPGLRFYTPELFIHKMSAITK